MSHNWIKTIVNFIVLLLLQEFLFNNIDLGIYVNIYIYIMFILLLPTSYSPLGVLLLSGIMGLAVDFFSGGILGLNMSACLVMGFLRPYVLKLVTTSSDSPQEVPVIYRAEIRKVLSYILLLVLAHHLTLFSLEAFNFSKIIFTLIRTICSTIITVIFILTIEAFLTRK